MDLIERIAIERECARLVVAYCNLADRRSYVEVSKLWAEDGTWTSLGGLLRGRGEILQSLEARPLSFGRHVISNVQIDVLNADEATGLSYFTLYKSETVKEGPEPYPLSGPMIVGRYRDKYKPTAEGWKIAHREILIDFRV